MVGILEQNNEIWGLVQSKAEDDLPRPARQLHGPEHGKINRITEDQIELTELIPDGVGGLHRETCHPGARGDRGERKNDEDCDCVESRLTMGSVGLAPCSASWALIATAVGARRQHAAGHQLFRLCRQQAADRADDRGASGRAAQLHTDNPARIALDFADTQSGLNNKNIAVGVGLVRSINAVEAATAPAWS